MKNIRRDLSDKHYVYLWADGIYFQVRLEADRPCVLVLIGATRDGRKELLAIEDGRRESKLSWHSVLTDLKRRGLKEAPAMAIGDGGLGFWAALEEVFPQTRHQRCWVHKSANMAVYELQEREIPASPANTKMSMDGCGPSPIGRF